MSKSKQQLRKEISLLRDSLSEEEKLAAKMQITELLWNHPWVKNAKAVLAFVNFRSEISTRSFINRILKSDKEIYLPKVFEGIMEFYKITNFEDLKSGYMGILEPEGTTKRYNSTDYDTEDSVMIMPGMVFDKDHNRIGYGGGFYDVYLAKNEALQKRTIAIGYKCQEIEGIPSEDTDIKPAEILLV